MKNGIVNPNYPGCEVDTFNPAKHTLVIERSWAVRKLIKPSLGRFVHVSQHYKLEKFTTPAGVEHSYYDPQYKDVSGRASGKTFVKPRISNEVSDFIENNNSGSN